MNISNSYCEYRKDHLHLQSAKFYLIAFFTRLLLLYSNVPKETGIQMFV